MTNLKQVHTYTTPEIVEELKIRARQHGMTMSKYIEYLIMKDIQKGKNSTTEKKKISLAKNYKGCKPIFFAKKPKAEGRTTKGEGHRAQRAGLRGMPADPRTRKSSESVQLFLRRIRE